MGRGDVDFEGGTRAELRSLSQSLTYEGLLEGVPTVAVTKQQIARVRDQWHGADRGHDALVLEPPLKLPDDGALNLPATRCLLPRIFCRARFSRWSEIAGHVSGEFHLTLVWWQEEWALPIAEGVLAELNEVNWADVAYEWSD